MKKGLFCPTIKQVPIKKGVLFKHVESVYKEYMTKETVK